jgi:hypothetical protein
MAKPIAPALAPGPIELAQGEVRADSADQTMGAAAEGRHSDQEHGRFVHGYFVHGYVVVARATRHMDRRGRALGKAATGSSSRAAPNPPHGAAGAACAKASKVRSQAAS